VHIAEPPSHFTYRQGPYAVHFTYRLCDAQVIEVNYIDEITMYVCRKLTNVALFWDITFDTCFNYVETVEKTEINLAESNLR
jgi:hypothetical protein